MLAQLLKKNGARRLVIAAPGGSKLDLARKLDIADEYIELDRSNPQVQWDKLRKDNPYGFDAVVCRVLERRLGIPAEATG